MVVGKEIQLIIKKSMTPTDEGTPIGYVSLESFNSDALVLFDGQSPPNFVQTCVFKVG